jgi:peptidoglycan/LPS O-acetylase OafA/YrhL
LSNASAAPKRAFIPELHGLRGLALALVVLFHLFGAGRVSGGIDIFLVISGFLFTGSLARQAIAANRINLVRHFSRVGSRLLPAALVTLAAVAVGMVLFLPSDQWIGLLRQLWACVTFTENWELVSLRVNYAAAGSGASPVQHFWSLAIQGQFYLVWPFLVLATVWIVRALRRAGALLPKNPATKLLGSWFTPLNALIAVTAALSAASLRYALYIGAGEQDVNYFNSFTRFWELGLGALLALVLAWLPDNRGAKLAAGWLGLALVLSSGFLLDGANLFPGPWALWPVGGALLVLYGSGAGPKSVASVLNLPVLHKLADISYPLYLWHWPLVVFAMRVFGWTGLGVPQASGVLAVSLALAWATQARIAGPMMSWVGRINPIRALAATVAMACFSALSLAGANAATQSRVEAALAKTAVRSAEHPGALVLDAAYAGKKSGFTQDFIPDTMVAHQDTPAQFNECMQSHVNHPAFAAVMECDPVGDTDNPEKTIVVTGGSHGIMWLPALEQLGQQLHWQFIAIVKGACPYFGAGTLDAPDGYADQTCIDWNANAEARILELRPDAVFTLGTRTALGAMEELYAPAVLGWEHLANAGIQVLAIRDIPRYETPRPECVETSGRDACAIHADHVFRAVNPLEQLPGRSELVAPLDLTPEICPGGVCAPVIGNVLVYWDDDHITKTYMKTLAPALLAELEAKAPRMF